MRSSVPYRNRVWGVEDGSVMLFLLIESGDSVGQQATVFVGTARLRIFALN